MWLDLPIRIAVAVHHMSAIHTTRFNVCFMASSCVISGNEHRQSLDTLANRIGVSQGYLSTVEHGQGEIRAEVLLTIGREFEKSLEWLLTGKE